MNKETYEALKRLIFTLHKTPVQGINGNDFVMVRDWIDESGKEYEEEKTIKITIEGGMVANVEGLPNGYLYEIDDRDI